jgi:hypothetical protein
MLVRHVDPPQTRRAIADHATRFKVVTTHLNEVRLDGQADVLKVRLDVVGCSPVTESTLAYRLTLTVGAHRLPKEGSPLRFASREALELRAIVPASGGSFG